MVKKSKRKQDIKSKLVAAVAMLMVATIMMVSSTYAWFTLSTAPEIQGITTTVGSNGSLEIALSPASGNGAEVGDATLENVTDDWYVKNLTWGNLLDLSDEKYNLGALKLLPAALPLAAENGGFTLGAAPLGTPVYGADGRITGLQQTSILGGLTNGVRENGYAEGGDYGVRAVGTASSQTPQQQMHKLMLAAIKSNAAAASGAASSSMTNNGNALANIMVKHGQAGSPDNNNYKDYVAGLQSLTADLDASVNYIEAMLVATMKLAIVTLEDTAESKAYTNAATALENATKVAEVQAAINTAGVTLPNQLTASIAAWEAIAAKVSASKTAANALASKDTVAWADLSPVLTNLMNTESANAVTINGKNIDEIKSIMGDYDQLMEMATNTNIILGAGSGVYYDIAAMTGNFNAKTTATVSATMNGEVITVTLKNVTIKTDVTGDIHRELLVAAANGITPVSTGAANIIDVNYGYVLDFMFRTNASGSKLLLQTDGAQRVYEDSANEDTMGKGSNFTFTTTITQEVSVIIEMCKGLRVAFFDPQSKTIYGIAKATKVTSTEEGAIYTITATLELCQYQANGKGYASVGDALPDSDTVTTYNDGAILCDLPQNIPTAVSALVYLDGNNITNSDVLDNESTQGELNLQFASTAELKPMENTDLKNGGSNP